MSLKYRAGRLELVNGNAGNFAAASKFKSVLVGPTSTYLLEHPTTVGGFTVLAALTSSSDKTLTTVAYTTDTARDRIYVDADHPAWTGLTPDDVIDGIVIYRFVTNMGLSIPYWGIQLGQPVVVPASGEYAFPFNADGIIEI